LLERALYLLLAARPSSPRTERPSPTSAPAASTQSAKFSVDPFVSITRSPNLFEPAYFDQTRLAKKNFWLNRFEVDAVGWFWELCGLIDIRETLLGELSVYCREEFAFVCDAMWQCIIGINVERAHLAQHGNVHTRTLEALTVTQIDRAN
jgi:hypothetical protein